MVLNHRNISFLFILYFFPSIGNPLISLTVIDSGGIRGVGSLIRGMISLFLPCAFHLAVSLVTNFLKLTLQQSVFFGCKRGLLSGIFESSSCHFAFCLVISVQQFCFQILLLPQLQNGGCATCSPSIVSSPHSSDKGFLYLCQCCFLVV